MGRDKALMRLVPDGPPLAEHVARILDRAGLHPIRLVGRQPALRTLSFAVLDDPAKTAHHPLFGFAAALADAAVLSAQFAVLVPCDVPALTPEAIAPLVACDGPAVALTSGRIQPMFAKVPSAWAHAALAAAREGWSARRFLDRPDVARVELSAGALSDLDTPEDFANWMRASTRDE